MYRWMILLGLLCLTPLLVAVEAPICESAPPQSVDFLGMGGSTLDGRPLSQGDVVRAYDPAGILAGDFVHPGGADYEKGWYGLMPVYGDCPDTPEEDEGAEAGDSITFTVNGHQAIPRGPDQPIWTQSSDWVHVELEACTLKGDFDCDCTVSVADLMRHAQNFGSKGQNGYYPPYDYDGDDDVDASDLRSSAGFWRSNCQS